MHLHPAVGLPNRSFGRMQNLLPQEKKHATQKLRLGPIASLSAFRSWSHPPQDCTSHATQAQTRPRARATLRVVRVVLTFSASHSALPSSRPNLFPERPRRRTLSQNVHTPQTAASTTLVCRRSETTKTT
eukprot:1642770-Pleurochrysis_carterae.AAC.1